jgi:hyaluronan synthase
MSGLEPLEALLLYVPLSIIGLWRWSYWLIRRLGAAAYRPKVRPWPEGEKRPSVTIVTPVYNEDPELFDKAVRSWMLNGVEEIVAVIDKSNVSHIMHCQREYVDAPMSPTRFKLVVTPKPGKRAALCDGIELATGDLIALVDSDTLWDDDVVEKTIPYFRDPAVGGATVAQRISNPDSIGNVLFDILLFQRYREEVPFLLGVGRVFNTLSGRTAFYRRQALLDPDFRNMHDLRHEFFLGSRAVSGDDKRLSHLVIAQGWDTAYVLGTTVYTPGLGGLKDFFKQRLRWTRNSWRSDLRAMVHGWVWKHPALAFFMIDRFVSPFFMLIGPVVFVLAVWNRQYTFASVLAAWWLISRFIRVFGYFRLHPDKILYLPAYVAYGYANAALKIYAMATLRENSWATRWSAKRAARKSRVQKGITLTQGYLALAACAFLLTHLAWSFREQVGANVTPQPHYSMAALRQDIDVREGVQQRPPAPLSLMPRDRLGVYTVRSGDNPDSLMRKMDVDSQAKLARIKQFNTIKGLDDVTIGQRLYYVKGRL